MIRVLTMGLFLAAAAVPGFAADTKSKPAAKGEAEECAGSKDDPATQRVFELRTYITTEGKLEALHKRSRDHTNRLFKKHGMELVGYWTPKDEKDGKANTLIYVLAFPSREAAAASWKAFQADPEWHKARDESHK